MLLLIKDRDTGENFSSHAVETFEKYNQIIQDYEHNYGTEFWETHEVDMIVHDDWERATWRLWHTWGVTWTDCLYNLHGEGYTFGQCSYDELNTYMHNTSVLEIRCLVPTASSESGYEFAGIFWAREDGNSRFEFRVKG